MRSLRRSSARLYFLVNLVWLVAPSAMQGQVIQTSERSIDAPKALPAQAPSALDAISARVVNRRAQDIHRDAEKVVRRPGSRMARAMAPIAVPPVVPPETPPPGIAPVIGPSAVEVPFVKAFNEA